MRPHAPVVSLLNRLRTGFSWSTHQRLQDPRLKAVHECLRASKPGLLTRTPLARARFVVIDTETTGLHVYAGDEIVSIALIELQGLEPTGQVYTTLVNPRRDIPPLATGIHHISSANVAGAPEIDEVLFDVIQFIGDSILIGHHVQFDIRFLNKTLYQRCRCRLRHPCLDTMMLYTALHGRLGHYTLEEVAQDCRVTIHGRHTAYGDAMATAAIFQVLAPRLSRAEQPVSRLIQCQRAVGQFRQC
jgi:DNA polymerase-3 subunit epsilon